MIAERSATNTPMTIENQLDLLEIRNETFLRDLRYFEEAESTNTLANELAATDCDTPLVVLAQRQTAGRGRNENQWWSSEGALTFTLLMDLPVRNVSDIGPFSLTVGLAVCQALERFAPAADLALKWPNDVYFNDKKVCGILIERPVASEPRLSIGIGINVNNSLGDAPEELRTGATSLLDELRSPQPLTAVLVQVLQRIEELAREHIHNRDRLIDQWRAYCMLTGRTVTIDQQGRQVRGVCRGVELDGSLVLQTEESEVKCISGVVADF